MGLAVVAATAVRAQDPDTAGGRGEKVDGYAEWREGACLIVDGQKVCPAPAMKFKGEGDAKSYDSVPLGYELKAEGKRRADGALLALKMEAKPNGSGMIEAAVRSATDQVEKRALREGPIPRRARAARRRASGGSSPRAPRSTASAGSSTRSSRRTCTRRTCAST